LYIFPSPFAEDIPEGSGTNHQGIRKEVLRKASGVCGAEKDIT
jgi:hypothetical protein